MTSKPIGMPDENIFMDSQSYEVEYSDGMKETMYSKIIADYL